MTDNLDNLRPEVRDALMHIRPDTYRFEINSWNCVRTELLRLTHENAQLRDVLADRDMDREMAAHANKELAALKARIQWQPISTAPTDGTCILVSDADGDVRHAHWDKPGWWCGYDCYGNDAFVEDPTMWMPLPPPKGEE